MKNTPKILQNKNLIGRFSIARRGNQQKSSQATIRVGLMQERLFFLKTREIIDELTQIMISIKKLEVFGFDSTKELQQIHMIQSKLRSVDRNYKYTKVVHIITKYLKGMKKISLTTNTRGVFFYKKLFESTLIAITRELGYLEEDVC